MFGDNKGTNKCHEYASKRTNDVENRRENHLSEAVDKSALKFVP